MNALRLLYLLPAEGFGGAERQGVYHLAELPRHGVNVTALVGPGELVLQSLRDAGASYERFEHFPNQTHAPHSSLGDVRHGMRWLTAIRRSTIEIHRRFRDSRFDLIFANRTFAWLVAAALSRRTGVPYVLRAGSRPVHPALPLGLPMLGRIAPPVATFYNCRAVARTVTSRLRSPSYALPNAIDTRRFAPASRENARTRLGLPAAAPLIGLAARPAPEKGFELLARVVRHVRRVRPDATFVVAGEFGWRTHYETKLRAAGLGTAVRFLGHVEAMPDFYNAVDIVILTSRSRSIEASPNSLLEAMATARPVVATAVGGVPDLVRHGEHGYLTLDDDDEGFAGHVLELLSEPERRLEFGRTGRVAAESAHGISSVVGGLARNLNTVHASLA